MDRIGPNLLKHCALALYSVLHHLYSLCLCQCYIPADWRVHLIIPSLLCVLSKILERLVFNHLIQNSLSSTQYGFRRKHSTLQQMLVFLNKVYAAMNSNSQADVLYLDFKKLLIQCHIMSSYWTTGVTGNTWRFLRCYLNERVQCVSINNSVSNPLPVVSGVPQGSILGPLLFLIFVNDLPDSISSSDLLLFADDAKCAHKIVGISDCQSLQHDLDNIFSWCNQQDKCTLVRYTSKPTPVYTL